GLGASDLDRRGAGRVVLRCVGSGSRAEPAAFARKLTTEPAAFARKLAKEHGDPVAYVRGGPLGVGHRVRRLVARRPATVHFGQHPRRERGPSRRQVVPTSGMPHPCRPPRLATVEPPPRRSQPTAGPLTL